MIKFLALALSITIVSAAFSHHGDDDLNFAVIPINFLSNDNLGGILGTASIGESHAKSFYKYRTLTNYGNNYDSYRILDSVEIPINILPIDVLPLKRRNIPIGRTSYY